MRNFIIFGPPGAGKGTQAQRIADALDLKHLSTGALLREEVSRQTNIGQRVQDLMAKGELVDDNIVDEIIKNKVENSGQVAGFIFDGYPRTISQANYLDVLLAAKALPLILNLEVSAEELSKRLILRGQTTGRADDNQETIKNRLIIYQQQTQPLLDFYASQKRLISVDGQGEIEEVYRRLSDQIK
jgi:adenylate kinase